LDEEPKSPLSISYETPEYEVAPSKIQSISRFVCSQLGVPNHQLSISFVSSDTIQEINKEHRKKDKPTDVLSFPQCEFETPLVCNSSTTQVLPFVSEEPPQTLGDIIISLDDAKTNAMQIGQDLSKETTFLLVHGILHLCGHDHETNNDEEIMLKEQRTIMSRLETLEEPPIWTDLITATKVGDA